MKNLTLAALLALNVVSGAAMASQPAAAQGLFGGNIGGAAGAFHGGPCVGQCLGIVHRAVPVARGTTVAPMPVVHMTTVPMLAPPVGHIAPPPGQGTHR